MTDTRPPKPGAPEPSPTADLDAALRGMVSPNVLPFTGTAAEVDAEFRRRQAEVDRAHTLPEPTPAQQFNNSTIPTRSFI